MRDEASTEAGWVRADEREEPPHNAEAAKHCFGLGGSFIGSCSMTVTSG